MPIVVVGTPVITPPGGGDGTGTGALPTSAYPLATFSATLEGNGDEISLTSAGYGSPYLMVRGAQGFDMPPVALFSDPLPNTDGDYYRGVRHGVRQLRIPILVYGPTQPIARSNQRRLLRLLSPKAGPVKVTVAQSDGTSRYIYGRYAGGAEGDWGANWDPNWDVFGFAVDCFDPYFYDTQPIEYLFRLGVSTRPFLSETVNFFPVQLAQSQISFDNLTVVNDGDVESYPTWLVTGPTSGVTFTNNDTGDQFVLGAISGGQTVRVVTQAPFQSVRDQADTNLWTLLTTGSDLFTLPPGTSHLSVLAEDVGEATQVTLSYQRRYLAA